MLQCVESVTHSDCPVCLEDLHTSREMLHILTCGHVTHLLVVLYFNTLKKVPYMLCANCQCTCIVCIICVLY